MPIGPTERSEEPDFAAYESSLKDGYVSLRAVNAHGVVYRVRSPAHEPKAGIAFWKEPLARKLTAEGYLVLSTLDLTLVGQPGAVIQAVAPLAGSDYGFLVAFAPAGDRLVIVESTGPQAELDKAKPAIMAAMQTVGSEAAPRP